MSNINDSSTNIKHSENHNIKPSHLLNNTKMHRVKLYQLEFEGKWKDQGVAQVVCKYLASIQAPGLLITREDDPEKIILQSKIQQEDIYERQGDNIIMWRETQKIKDESSGICNIIEADYALSFEEISGCHSIWDAIGEVQSQYLQQHNFGLSQTVVPKNSTVNCHNLLPIETTANVEESDEDFVPFPITKENLVSLKKKLLNSSGKKLEECLLVLTRQDCEYLKNLLMLFQSLEIESEVYSLNLMCEVWRIIIMLGDQTILKYSLTDAFTLIAGIFEYDASLGYKGNFRNFIINQAKLHEVVPIEDVAVKQSIHLLYRMKYLKDYLIRPAIDEPGLGSLQAMIMYTSIEIATKMFENTSYLQKIFDIITKPQSSNNNIAEREIDNFEPTASCTSSRNSDIDEEKDLSLLSNDPCEYQTEYDTSLTESNLLNIFPSKNNFSNISGNDLNDQKSNITMDELCRNDRLDGIKFLRELFFLSRNFNVDRRYELYSSFLHRFKDSLFSLITDNLFPASIKFSINSDSSLKQLETLLLTEIMSTLTSVCPMEVRLIIMSLPAPSLPPYVNSSFGSTSFNAASKSNYFSSHDYTNMMLSIILCLIYSNDCATIEHLSDVIKLLLDPDNHRPSSVNAITHKSDIEKFLELFYDYYIHWMTLPFIENLTWAIPNHSLSAEATSKKCLIEIFTLCVLGHAYRMKYFIIRNNIISRFNRFFEEAQPTSCRHLILNVIKFFRSILAVKDEFYHRHIIKMDLFKSIIVYLEEQVDSETNELSNNLITSAIIELLESIRFEGISSLIIYLVDKHIQNFKHNCLKSQFKEFLLRYEQILDSDKTFGQKKNNSGNNNVSKKDYRFEQMSNEEMYFECGDDIEDSSLSASVLESIQNNLLLRTVQDGIVGLPVSNLNLKGHISNDNLVSSNKVDSLSLLSELYDDYDNDDEDHDVNKRVRLNQDDDNGNLSDRIDSTKDYWSDVFVASVSNHSLENMTDQEPFPSVSLLPPIRSKYLDDIDVSNEYFFNKTNPKKPSISPTNKAVNHESKDGSGGISISFHNKKKHLL